MQIVFSLFFSSLIHEMNSFQDLGIEEARKNLLLVDKCLPPLPPPLFFT